MSEIADLASSEHDTSSPDAVEAVVPNTDESTASEASSESSAFIRQGIFPFLRLPPEIRISIYRIVLVSSEPLYIYCHKSCSRGGTGCYCSYEDRVMPHPNSQRKKNLKVFLVSCQVWTEASDVFYAENLFTFDLHRPGPSLNGFHPSLKRIKMCFLWTTPPACNNYLAMNWTPVDLDGYPKYLLMAFADALAEGNQLQFLIFDTPFIGNALLKPLEALRGIKRVDVLHAWTAAQHLNSGISYSRYLRVLMMSDGEYSSIADITREDIERSEEALAKTSGSGKEGGAFARMQHFLPF